jgi:hypothetical protein
MSLDVPILVTPDERVEWLAAELSTGRWHPRRARDCAERWQVAETTVRHHTAEARRFIGLELGSTREQIREAIAGQLHGITQIAESTKQLKTAVYALEVLSRVLRLTGDEIAESASEFMALPPHVRIRKLQAAKKKLFLMEQRTMEEIDGGAEQSGVGGSGDAASGRTSTKELDVRGE